MTNIELSKWLRDKRTTKCGYIMGATGQNPRDIPADSWMFTQYADRSNYSAKQEAKAKYWREHAPYVYDCAGMAEAFVSEVGGYPIKDINTKARYIYSEWCAGNNSTDMNDMPRMPGVAVFKRDRGAKVSEIHHIGYLDEPVTSGKPEGDWYITEAKGVLYGVVRTKLSDGGWNSWGLMKKYIEYIDEPVTNHEFGDTDLEKGSTGDDVKTLQTMLNTLGFDCGAVDGIFGNKTKTAVIAYQKANGIIADGVVGEKTFAALSKGAANTVTITGGSVNVRAGADTTFKVLGVAHKGDTFTTTGKTDGRWVGIVYNGTDAWVSSKYLK